MHCQAARRLVRGFVVLLMCLCMYRVPGTSSQATGINMPSSDSRERTQESLLVGRERRLLPEKEGDAPAQELQQQPQWQPAERHLEATSPIRDDIDDDPPPLIAARACVSNVAQGLHMRPRASLSKLFSPELSATVFRWGVVVKRKPRALPSMVLHRPPIYAGATPAKNTVWKRCALVGSAGVLKGSGWGSEIDKDYDAVIRLNNAPTITFEKDVGTRTTLRFIQDWHLQEHNFRELERTDAGGLVVVWPSPNHPNGRFGGPKASWEPQKVGNTTSHLTAKNVDVVMTRISDMMYHVAAALGQRHNGGYPPYVPSSGWYAMLMSLHLCSSLDIIGYSWETAQETAARRSPGGNNTATERGGAYYFLKHQAGKLDEAAYYRNRIDKNRRSHHKLGTENNSIRRIARACGVRLR